MITAVGARLTAMDARPTAMDARHWAPSILLEGLNWHLLRPVQGDRRGRFLNTFDLTESARQRTFWNRAPRGCEPSSKVPLALSPEWGASIMSTNASSLCMTTESHCGNSRSMDGHRFYCLRTVTDSGSVTIILLNGWKKEKPGKGRNEERQEIKRAQRLRAEYEQARTGGIK